MSIFAGGVPNDRNLINFYADGGLIYKGLIPHRSRLPLLRALESHADHRIADFAKLEGLRLTQEAERERL